MYVFSPDPPRRISQVAFVLQFSSLEPDILCRLVYVKDVELTAQADTAAQQPPAGQLSIPQLGDERQRTM